MYKAKIDIGGFKKGDKVPDDKALVWKDMYKESPVEEILMTEAQLKAQEKKEAEAVKKAEEAEIKATKEAEKIAEKEAKEKAEEEAKKAVESKPESETSDDSSDALLDDYLNRNENVVLKNLHQDPLNHSIIEKLIKIENSDKKRDKILKALKRKLEVN